MSYCTVWFFLLTGFLGVSGALGLLKSKFNRGEKFSPLIVLLLSSMLTPVLISLQLWLIMVLLPGRFSGKTILIMIGGIFSAASLSFLRYAAQEIGDAWKEYTSFCRTEFNRWSIGVGILILAAMFVFIAVLALLFPVKNFDMVEYALAGDWFAETRSIVYNGIFVRPENGFILFFYHSFCYPLFGTFGAMLHEYAGLPPDWYLKFISGFYWIMLNLMAFVFFCNRRRNNSWLLPLCGMLLLNAVPITGDRLIFFGIDFFRIAFLTAAIGLEWIYIKKPSVFKGILVASFLAIAASAHGLQAILIPFFCMLLLVSEGTWRQKITNTVCISAVVVVLGYSHYLLQFFYGDGWLFYNTSQLFPASVSASAPVPVNAAVNAAANAKVSLANAQGANQFIIKYLGQAFNFEFFSLSVLTALLMLAAVVYRKISERQINPRRIVLALCLIACFSIIALRFYFNYRYQYTLFFILVLAGFACYMKLRLNRIGVALVLICTLLSLGVSSYVLYRHLGELMDFNTKKTTCPHSVSTVVLTEKEFWRTLQDDHPGNVCLVAKNKSLLRVTPLPLCYLTSAKRGGDNNPSYVPSFNWKQYPNPIFKIGAGEKKVIDHFSHIIVQKNFAVKSNAIVKMYKSEDLIAESAHYKCYRVARSGSMAQKSGGSR